MCEPKVLGYSMGKKGCKQKTCKWREAYTRQFKATIWIHLGISK